MVSLFSSYSFDIEKYMQASKIKQRKKDYFRLDPRLGCRSYEVKMISVFLSGTGGIHIG